MKRIIIMILVLFFATINFAFAMDGKDALDKVRTKIQKEFNELDESFTQATSLIKKSEINESCIRNALTLLCNANSFAIDCSFINKKGVMQYVEPSYFKRFEGTDISGQKQVQEVQKTKKPVLSDLFVSVEGTYSIDVEYPVIDNKKEFQGSLSILFRPDAMLADILKSYKDDYIFTVLQADGVCIYDDNYKLIGRNLKTSRKHAKSEGFIDAMETITRQKQGTSSYGLISPVSGEEFVEKIRWDTVSLYGQDWRIVITEKNKE
ncbi:MAG: hypothetical protein ACLFQV_09300 [Vulcanimicrobiota bacterium]